MPSSRTSRPLNRALAAALLAAAVAACSDPSAPGHSDIPTARAAWLDAAIADYTFEIAVQNTALPLSGYIHVRVLDGSVASATDENGSPINDYDLTIEAMWQRILESHDSGQLKSVRFDRRGVPIEVDIAAGVSHGGYTWFVRNFAPEAS